MFVAGGRVGESAGATFNFGRLLGETSGDESRAGVSSERVGEESDDGV